jgi:putative acetyltransferase
VTAGGTIRAERPEDRAAIADVHADAFGRTQEGTLVDRLRAEHPDGYGPSLVAEVDGYVVGHVLLSSVTLEAEHRATLLALAPVAVLRTYQGLGIGSALVTRVLELAEVPVVVVGAPRWYRRFGFEPAGPLGISGPWPGAGDAWMVWFPAGADQSAWRGRVGYPAPFYDL